MFIFVCASVYPEFSLSESCSLTTGERRSRSVVTPWFGVFLLKSKHPEVSDLSDLEVLLRETLPGGHQHAVVPFCFSAPVLSDVTLSCISSGRSELND